jgi:hypothetical protein
MTVLSRASSNWTYRLTDRPSWASAVTVTRYPKHAFRVILLRTASPRIDLSLLWRSTRLRKQNFSIRNWSNVTLHTRCLRPLLILMLWGTWWRQIWVPYSISCNGILWESLYGINIITSPFRTGTHSSRGLRHEIYSPVQTLGLWFRIPPAAWMTVHVSSVFVLSCVCSGLSTGLIPV